MTNVAETESPASRLSAVQEQIAKCAKANNRDPAEITLIAVSKTFIADRITPVIQAGQRIFGENRIQESQAKWPDMKVETPDCELHLIGPLQTNKVADAIALFDVIHTVDRTKLARTLAAEMEKQQRRLPVFIQVNTGEEDQKAGVLPLVADAFIEECRDTHGLNVIGLMCIPPIDEEPAMHFALLKKIADRNGLSKLSMGMSADFETAIQFGATHIRVGSAIFGARG